MILNYYSKINNSWTNYSGRVTSHNMIEKEMGYRGSKTAKLINKKAVKEQRVDGSFLFEFNLDKIKIYSIGLWEQLS